MLKEFSFNDIKRYLEKENDTAMLRTVKDSF